VVGRAAVLVAVAVVAVAAAGVPSARAQVDRIGLHVTQSQLEVWRTRAEQGPYKSRGDAGYKTPADWEYITGAADAFMANPDAENFETGYTGTGCIPAGYHEPVLDLGFGIRDAAFESLVTDNETMRRAVVEELLWQAREPSTDFSNRSVWCTEPPESLGGDDAFIFAEWVTRLVLAYDYVRPYVSQSERQTLDTWFLEAGRYFQQNVDTELAELFDDREAGTLSATGRSRVEDVDPDQITHHGGWQVTAFHRVWNNRRSTQMRLVALIGLQQEDPTLKNSAKQWVKDALKYGFFPDGVPVEYHRSHGDKASVGWSYAGVTTAHLAEIADHFARAGDTELLAYSTSDGVGESAGGPKSVRMVVEHFFATMDGSTKLYNYTGTDGAFAARMDGYVADEDRFYTYDIWFAGINNYWQDAELRRKYLEMGPEYLDLQGRGATVKNTGPYFPWGGSGDVYPGLMFMFADMEDEVDPYPSRSATAKAGLTASTTAVDYDAAPIGSSTAAKTVRFANETSEPVRVTSIGASEAAFDLASAPNVPFDVQPGDGFDVEVAFAPASRGSASGTLVVEQDTVSTPTTVALQGEGVIDPSTSLLAAYDFTSDGDSQVLVDRTGNGFDGTLGESSSSDASDPSWSSDGLSFDGGDDFVGLGDVFDVGASQDLSLLVRFRVGEPTRSQDLFNKRNPGTSFFFLRVANGGLRFQLRDAAGTDVANVSGGTVSAGEVHVAHVVIDNDAGTARLGLDGTDVATASFPAGTDFSGDATATLGALVSGGQRYNPLGGALFDAEVYRVALSAAEMAKAVETLGASPGSASLSARPDTLAFGRVTIGSTSSTRQAWVKNEGGAEGTITDLSVRGPFTIANAPSLPLALAAGDSAAVDVAFAPTAEGAATGELVATGGDGQSVAAVLTGDGAREGPTLLAEYDFRPGSDPQVLADRTGNGFDGRLGTDRTSDPSDPTWTDLGLSFDGEDDFVSFGNVFDVASKDDQTVLVYFRAASQHSGDLWVKRDADAIPFSFLRYNRDGVQVQHRNAAGTDVAKWTAFDGSVPADSFMLASKRLDNGSDVTAGVNGAAKTSERSLDQPSDFSSSAGVTAGAYVTGSRRYNPFHGTMAYARVYDGVLSDAEVAAAYDEIEAAVAARESRQDIALTQGWNLVGSSVDPSNPDIEAVMAGIESEVGMIKDEEGNTYIPGTTDDIGTWDAFEGYMVYVASDVTLAMQGTRTDPGRDVPLAEGWNIVPFLPGESMPVEEAVSSISSSLAIVLDENGNIYLPEYDIDEIGTLKPKHAYEIYVTQDVVLTYP
jgi:hypothetical protein